METASLHRPQWATIQPQSRKKQLVTRLRRFHSGKWQQAVWLLTFASIQPLALQADESSSASSGGANPVGEIVELDPLVITDSNSLVTTLPVRPVTGVYGFATNYQDIPRSITQINPEQFASDIISSYSDFQRYSPSVNQSTGQIANYGSPTIRGSKSDAYQNGVRLLTRQQNNRPFTLNAYEGADIVAGPAPVIFGPSERTSGYVDYLTKKAYFDKQHTTINLRLGKFYADGTGFKDNENWQIDNGGPLIKDELAYRISYQGENIHAYQYNGGDKYHDIFGTLAWLPNKDLTIDWNFEYGDFEWLVNNGYNRVTNDLIRNGTYLSGPATPIIQGAFAGGDGKQYYSPVYKPGIGFDGTSFIKRTASKGQFLPGDALTGAPTDKQAGTIVGYVLDPALVKPVQLNDNAALNAPGYPSSTAAFNTQLRIKKRFGERFSVLNNALYQYYTTDTASNGGFYNWIRTHTIEDRTEGLLSLDFNLFGLPILHDSNTGVSYRYEQVHNYKDSQKGGYGPTGDQYDLTGDPTTFTRNAFFGAPVYPFSGTASTPVATRFGYLKGFYPYLTVPESTDNAVSPGGSDPAQPWLSSATNHTDTGTLSFYSQHRFALGEKFFVDTGARISGINSKITNPLPLNAANATIEDSIDTWIPGWSASLSFKPVSRITTYVTYAYIQAVNGMTTGSPTWANVNGVTNIYDPAAFESLSELKEAGVKAELVPGQLFGAISVYSQTRDLTLQSVPNADPIRAKGLYEGFEANLRYQPSRAFTIGINYSYLSATTLNQNISAPKPLQADNATNILGTTALGLGDWRITNLPRNSGSLFASYEFESGFGVKTDLWVRDRYLANNYGIVTVPSEYNLNLSLFYNQPSWTVALDFQNVTNERNFAGASTLLEPLSIQGRFTYRF
ncbi:MAG: TonB-dependent receptor plug domain-containing protein [Verrucomicrobiota bacterium]|nr:TonB-dependent receptor plug domain-containing protein [Verrucomicrobiota bacterium]